MGSGAGTKGICREDCCGLLAPKAIRFRVEIALSDKTLLVLAEGIAPKTTPRFQRVFAGPGISPLVHESTERVMMSPKAALLPPELPDRHPELLGDPAAPCHCSWATASPIPVAVIWFCPK